MKSFAALVLNDELELPVMWVVNLIFIQSRGPCRMFGLMSPSRFVNTSTSVRSKIVESTMRGHRRGITLLSVGITDTDFLNSGRECLPLCSTS